MADQASSRRAKYALFEKVVRLGCLTGQPFFSVFSPSVSPLDCVKRRAGLWPPWVLHPLQCLRGAALQLGCGRPGTPAADVVCLEPHVANHTKTAPQKDTSAVVGSTCCTALEAEKGQRGRRVRPVVTRAARPVDRLWWPVWGETLGGGQQVTTGRCLVKERGASKGTWPVVSSFLWRTADADTHVRMLYKGLVSG